MQAQFGRDDPRDFIRDVLKWAPTVAAIKAGYKDPWTPQQEQVLAAIKDHRKVAVPAGVNLGKSYLAAAIALWFLYSRKPSLVITTAPTWDLIAKVLWAKIHTLVEQAGERGVKLPGALNQLELRLASDWFMQGLNAQIKLSDPSATGFHGRHSENVLVIMDEATDIDPAMWEAARNAIQRPGDRWLAIGNPTDPSSHFAEVVRDPTWHVISLSGEDHPNVVHKNPDIIPGAVTADWIADSLSEYGSREAPMYQAKVLGRFPVQASDALISMEWLEAARKRERARIALIESGGELADDQKGVALGLDVAGEGSDLTVLSAVQNSRWFIPEIYGRYTWHVGRDVMAAVDLVLAACKTMPVRVLVLDDTGLGQGVTARLRQIMREEKSGLSPYLASANLPRTIREHTIRHKDVWILPRNFGSQADEAKRFVLTKDELWWNGREVLRTGGLLIPEEPEMKRWGLPRGHDLRSQLMTPIYDAASNMGRIAVYDKRNAHGAKEKTRLLPDRSPDIAHSFLMAVWGWQKLKAAAPVEVPKTQQDIQDRLLRETIDKAIAREHPRMKGVRKGPGLSPWQRGKSR